jgi:4-hydroxybenzoate polyprenyltransferase
VSLAARARAWFDLLRIFNLPIPLAGMIAGAYSTVPEPSARWRLAVVPLVALLGCAVTQSFNDYEDRDVDAVNAPFRPLPAKRLTPGGVLRGGYLMTLLGAAISIAVEHKAALVVPVVFLLTRFYPRMKKITVLNHLFMPGALAMTPIYGALIVHGRLPPLALFAAASIFFMDINMNIVGSFKDLWDDSAQERVAPVVFGARPAVVIALVAGLLGLAVQVAAVALGFAGAGLLLGVAVATTFTVRSRLRLYRAPSAVNGYAALQAGRLAECFSFPAVALGVLPLEHGIPLVASCVFLALYTQTIIPENILPEAANTILSSPAASETPIESGRVAVVRRAAGSEGS